MIKKFFKEEKISNVNILKKFVAKDFRFNLNLFLTFSSSFILTYFYILFNGFEFILKDYVFLSSYFGCFFSQFLFLSHLKQVNLNSKLFFDKAEAIIKNKTKENLTQEINNLLENNAFVQKYFDLFKNDNLLFKQDFEKVLNELNYVYGELFSIDVEDFFKNFEDFKSLEKNINLVAFLLYLNNCYLLLHSKEFLINKDKKNIKQLTLAKKNNLLPNFRTDGNTLINSINFDKVKI